MTLASWAQTRTAHSGVQGTNHYATVPPLKNLKPKIKSNHNTYVLQLFNDLFICEAVQN